MEEVDSDNNNKMVLTPQQRKQQLKEFLIRLQDIAEEEQTGEAAIRNIEAVLTDVNALEKEYPIIDRVDNPDETLTDVMVCKSISDLLLKHVNAIDISDKPYQGVEFASKLLEFLNSKDGDYVDLTSLAPFVDNAVNDVPQLTSVFGGFDINITPTPKEKEAREKKQPQEKVTKKQLIKVVEQENEEEGIDDTVRFLINVLKTEYEKNSEKPIDYYKYVIDSSDFGETIQNIFYTSFLVRDGRAKIDINKNGKPTIEPVRSKTLKEFRKNGGQNTQMISSIDMEFWRSCGIKEGYLQKAKGNKCK